MLIAELLPLPTGLGDSGNIAVESQLAKTDTADAELPDVTPGTPTTAAPVVSTHLEAGLTIGLGNQCFTGHNSLLG
jgi:hypothetical protein